MGGQIPTTSSDSFCHGFPIYSRLSPCIPPGSPGGCPAQLKTPAHDVMAVSISHFSSVHHQNWHAVGHVLPPWAVVLRQRTSENNRDIPHIPREQPMASPLRLDISPAPILRRDIQHIDTEISDSASRALLAVYRSSSNPDLSTAQGAALHRHRP